MITLSKFTAPFTIALLVKSHSTPSSSLHTAPSSSPIIQVHGLWLYHVRLDILRFFFSSLPPTTRSLPQKIIGKMTRRPRASSSKEASSSSANEISPDIFAVISSLTPRMSSKSVVKTINLLGLPEGFEILIPIE
ncbi:hypothetical protein Salat_2122600 [Sesamum alatum]|uniref:Uncharacterized protein n=1 Tax=Sesamum alatum TaxID=300844 RepID=A0AAE1Y0Y9_9LAMI|nr:hypothetical protein Salat_2122600 [Sesamum alatum]